MGQGGMRRRATRGIGEIAMRRGALSWGPSPAPLGALGLWTVPVGAAETPVAAPAVSGVEVLGQVTLSLLLVVALLLALAWALRRFNRLQPQGSTSLRLVGGLSVGARERILLVEAEDRRLLVGVSPAGLRTLLVLDGHARADAGGVPQGLTQGFPLIQGASLVPPGRAG